MKVFLICPWKEKASHDSPHRKWENEYLKRLQRFSLEIVHLNSEAKSGLSLSTLQSWVQKTFKHTTSPQIFLLDEKGKDYTSKAFAGLLEKSQQSPTPLLFVMGTAYGFAEDLKQQVPASHWFKLSHLTFPHRLARLVFIEQIYRSEAILSHSEYHHE